MPPEQVQWVLTLDENYSPFESTKSAVSAIFILALIFFGDIVVRWLGRR